MITKGHGIVLGNGNILFLIVLVTQLYAFAQSHKLYVTEGKLPDLKKNLQIIEIVSILFLEGCPEIITQKPFDLLFRNAIFSF